MNIFAILAKFTLWFFGWQNLTSDFVTKFNQHPRKVVIFPHTTYWDFPILAIYALTKWSEFHQQQVYIVMKPQLVNGSFGKFFRAFNCLPATHRSLHGEGFVEKIRKKFSEKTTYSIFIAPEGTTSLAEWKSGYFYLAKSLNCPIQVIALDYHRHCPVIKDVVSPTELKETQEQLKKLIATIPTLHPKQSIISSPKISTSLYKPEKPIIILTMIWFFFVENNLSLRYQQLIVFSFYVISLYFFLHIL